MTHAMLVLVTFQESYCSFSSVLSCLSPFLSSIDSLWSNMTFLVSSVSSVFHFCGTWVCSFSGCFSFGSFLSPCFPSSFVWLAGSLTIFFTSSCFWLAVSFFAWLVPVCFLASDGNSDITVGLFPFCLISVLSFPSFGLSSSLFSLLISFLSFSSFLISCNWVPFCFLSFNFSGCFVFLSLVELKANYPSVYKFIHTGIQMIRCLYKLVYKCIDVYTNRCTNVYKINRFLHKSNLKTRVIFHKYEKFCLFPSGAQQNEGKWQKFSHKWTIYSWSSILI